RDTPKIVRQSRMPSPSLLCAYLERAVMTQSPWLQYRGNHEIDKSVETALVCGIFGMSRTRWFDSGFTPTICNAGDIIDYQCRDLIALNLLRIKRLCHPLKNVIGVESTAR